MPGTLPPPQFAHHHQQQQQPESAQPHSPFYSRLPQPSQAWYYPSAQQQQPPPPVQHPQQHTQSQQHQQHQQQQQHHTKHSMSFQSYPPPSASTHSPLQQHPRGPFATAPSQAHLAPTPSPPTVTLPGPGSTDFSSSSSAGSYAGPGPTSGLGGVSRGVDAKTLGEDAERAAAGGLHLSKVRSRRPSV